ncbi:MAG: hypothetical protein KGO51_16125 [Alphaproteobacteria bacterium]|nr:hypothetical protein [Alphaproteobacteria bacterium]
MDACDERTVRRRAAEAREHLFRARSLARLDGHARPAATGRCATQATPETAPVAPAQVVAGS